MTDEIKGSRQSSIDDARRSSSHPAGFGTVVNEDHSLNQLVRGDMHALAEEESMRGWRIGMNKVPYVARSCTEVPYFTQPRNRAFIRNSGSHSVHRNNCMSNIPNE